MPWVFPKLAANHEQKVNLDLEFRNVGNGPALLAQAFLVTGVTRRTAIDEWNATGNVTGAQVDGPKWGALAPNESISLRHELFDNRQDENGLLIVTYSDIYARRFLSGYEYSMNNYAITLGEPIYPIMRHARSSLGGAVNATGESEDRIWESLQRIESKIDIVNDQSWRAWVIGIGIAAVVGAPGLRDLSINGMVALFVIGVLLIALSPLAHIVTRRKKNER